MRILFVIQSLDVGGAERQLGALVCGLRERGHAVDVAVLRRGTGSLADTLTAVGVSVHLLANEPGQGLGGAARRLVRLARRTRPQVVHGYMPVGNVLAMLVRCFFPSARIVFGLRTSRIDWSKYPRKTRLTEWIMCRVARYADLIIANSYAGAAYYATIGFPAARTRVVPNGIDIKKFAPDAEAGRRVRDELGVQPTERVVGLLARLDPLKDHQTFLRAAQHLLARVPTTRFVCAGSGLPAYQVHLEALAQALGISHAVTWLGHRDDTAAVFNAMDVAAFTSGSGEGFPNAVGEAMACGRPCVVTDVGDAARVVADTGIVVPPGSPGPLADALELALNDAEALGRNARRRVEEHFGLLPLVDRTERLLSDLVAGTAPERLPT